MNDRVLTLDEIDGWTGGPLVLFVGISTGGSTAHTVFDAWAAALDRPWTLRGVDLPPDTTAATYRRLLAAMRDNPHVDGAVITAHKLRLHRACAADLGAGDPLVELTREVNTVALDHHRRATGHAGDARSLTAILDPPDGRVVCLGAGGAATALLLALHLDVATGTPRPDPPDMVFADIDPAALTELHAVADRIGARPTLVHLTGPADEVVAGAALVVNATGLGKDRPGSPLTDHAPLGPGTLAWDLNYRGDLTFLRQAAALGAATMDGWDYFVAGWAGALTAVAGRPFDQHALTALAAAAAPHRPTGALR
ncbi:hypothetical protein ACQEVB_35930 [Pseudonocardia sp. CA-107938]|uniref:hypothetical protein n=1 Tax=Pseudonocardia sp. CA-107938 TaxID=3240021 RepID=UPI003D91D561